MYAHSLNRNLISPANLKMSPGKKSERPKTISKINKKSPSGLQNLQKWNKNRLEKLPRILVAYYLLGVSYYAVPLSE